MACNADQTLYAIREVSELTGVKPVTLRAWQRRYNILQPTRNEKGHRLYRQQDVDRIHQIQRWLQQGVSIRRVKLLLDDKDAPVLSEQPLEQVEQILESLSVLQRNKVDQLLVGLCKEYPFEVVIKRCIEPVFAALSLHKTPQRVVQESLFRGALLARLVTIVELGNKGATSGEVVVAYLQGTNPLLGWLEAATYSDIGHRVTVLDALDEVNLLLVEWLMEKRAKLVLTAAKPLTVKQQDLLQKLITSGLDVRMTRSLSVLQQEELLA